MLVCHVSRLCLSFTFTFYPLSRPPRSCLMSFSNSSDNYSRWLAFSRPQLWPSSDPACLYLSNDIALSPLLPWTLNDSYSNPEASAGSHKAVAGSVYVSYFPCSLSHFHQPCPIQSIQHLLNRLSQEQVLHLLNVGSPAAFLMLYQHSILTVFPIDGFHTLLCPHCFIFVKSSISVPVSLSITGHFTVLSNHYHCKSYTTQHVWK